MNPRHGSLCFIKNRIRRFTTVGKPAWPRVFALPSDWVYPRLRQALRGGIYQKVSTVGQRGIGREPSARSEIGSRPPRKSNQNSCQRVCRTEEETKAPISRLLTLVSIGLTPVWSGIVPLGDLLPCSLVIRNSMSSKSSCY